MFAFLLWDSSANRVACDRCPVPSENYMRGKEGSQMLNIPLHIMNWAVVMSAGIQIKTSDSNSYMVGPFLFHNEIII